MWFRNLTVYRLAAGPQLDRILEPAALASRLAEQAFHPTMALQDSALGWVPPRDSDPSLVIVVGRQLLLRMREERRLLPTQVVTRVVTERARAIEDEQGFKPGRKRLRELRDEVRDELLPRAFSLTSDTGVWIDAERGWLLVDTASTKRADAVIALLLRSVDDLPLRPAKTVASPSGEMTAWLASGQTPAGFSIDQDAVLRARDGKATIRYANQSIERDEIVRHTRAGKHCTRLALTWSDKVSFVLGEGLALRRVRALDVLKEHAPPEDLDAELRFVADVALMTGELARLLADLVAALGGESPERSPDAGSASAGDVSRAASLDDQILTKRNVKRSLSPIAS